MSGRRADADCGGELERTGKGRSLSLCLLLALSCAHAPPQPRSTEQLVAASLPSLVLLVGERPDGKTSFGSGIIVGHDGRVLTCLHLVRGMAHLRGMLFAPGPVSYTPMDGGLDRFLFENRARLVEVALDRIDEANDLAVVRIDADTSAVPLLPLHLAWVLLIGRNADGTEYRFSEVWAQDGSDRWHQCTPAGEEELKSLPRAFAPPLVLPGEMVARVQLELLGQLFAIGGRSKAPADHHAAR